MRFACLFAVILAAMLTRADANSDVVGIWEGESVCVVENPCHTEHVIYDIAAKPGSNLFEIRADKVVNGERQFMGSFDCTYDAARHRLSCPMEGRKPGDWVFQVDGKHMIGTLTVREGKQLFRNVRVSRKAT